MRTISIVIMSLLGIFAVSAWFSPASVGSEPLRGAGVPAKIGETIRVRFTGAAPGAKSAVHKMQAIACESLFDPDFTRTYQTYSDAIYWEFNLNFKAIDSQSGKPLGCLRFYGRDNNRQSYVPIDNGGIVIDSCTKVGNVEISTVGALESSNPKLQRSVNAGVAIFDGSGYITCVVDIATTLQKMQLPILHRMNPSDIEMIQKEIQQIATSPVRTYEELSFAAVGSNLHNVGPNPIVYYEPQNAACCVAAGLSLPGLTPEVRASYLLWIKPTAFQPTNPLQPQECSFRPESRQYWWGMFGMEAGTYAIEFAGRVMGDPTVNRCTNVAPPVPQSATQFWLGPTTIYIGSRPGRNPVGLTGHLYEVWIDPDRTITPGK